ncbi:MAG TPA: glycoside hydrolase family 76 protein [Terracidiphilus sp.]|nr:glycoside hydrolase family 76 protein [Terracidiphilus sp.]
MMLFLRQLRRTNFPGTLSLLALILIVLSAQTGTAQTLSSTDLQEQTQQSVDRLQHWYNQKTGLWDKTGWWNSANVLTVLIDYAHVTGSLLAEPVAANTHTLNAKDGFLNDYYDDEGWWALAWIDAYDLTGNKQYLDTAESIFHNMTTGWDNTCGGGIWWSKKRTYKNAIANELFLSVAAHLANRVADPDQSKAYLKWARREWKWFRHTGMIEQDHLISDGLDSSCKDNHKTKWSYNQGVILGGLSELSHKTGKKKLLRTAQKTADAAMVKLADKNGILHDPCEPKCGADGTQFKGIFVRNLSLLNQTAPQQRNAEFIVRNAESILTKDQSADHAFGVVWSGPSTEADPSTQSSALDALVAALKLEMKGNGE